MAPLAARLASARRQTRRAPIRATAIERELGTVYTVDTLCRLRRRYPEASGNFNALILDVAGLAPVALAQVLGRNPVCLMRAHGSVACGPTLQTAVFRAVYTEVNARVQHWDVALSEGEPLAALDAEEGRLADAVNQNAGMRAWDLWRAQVRAKLNW